MCIEHSVAEENACKNCVDDNNAKLSLFSIQFDICREVFLLTFWALLGASCSCGTQAFDYFLFYIVLVLILFVFCQVRSYALITRAMSNMHNGRNVWKNTLQCLFYMYALNPLTAQDLP